MNVEMIMPQMGESIAEGTILSWLKKEGEQVALDEPILEVSTDKVNSEIPAPATGVLAKILVAEGETVEVGTAIAVITTEAGDVVDAAAAPITPSADPKATSVHDGSHGHLEVKEFKRSGAPARKPEQGDGDEHFVSPYVRNRAEEEGIPLAEVATIPGSGRGGRVTKKDFEAYLLTRSAAAVAAVPTRRPVPAARPIPAAPAAGTTEVVPMDAMRKQIADHMVRSVQTAPHVTSVIEVDVTAIARFRDRVKDDFRRREGFGLSFLPFVIEASVQSLKDHPYVNSSLDGDKIILKKFYNIGVAVAVENGLLVPVVRGADEMNLVGIARVLNDVAERARSKKLTPDDVQDGTFTITNMGSFGNLIGMPIIHQPQVAILCMGLVVKRPVVVAGDAIAIRDMMYLSLSYDHRVLDGAQGGRFLQDLGRRLEGFDEGRQL